MQTRKQHRSIKSSTANNQAMSSQEPCGYLCFNIIPKDVMGLILRNIYEADRVTDQHSPRRALLSLRATCKGLAAVVDSWNPRLVMGSWPIAWTHAADAHAADAVASLVARTPLLSDFAQRLHRPLGGIPLGPVMRLGGSSGSYPSLLTRMSARHRAFQTLCCCSWGINL